MLSWTPPCPRTRPTCRFFGRSRFRTHLLAWPCCGRGFSVVRRVKQQSKQASKVVVVQLHGFTCIA